MTNNTINAIMDSIDLTNKTIDENKLYFLTGKNFTIEEVIKKSHELDTAYRHIYQSYGFEDFYSMYIYASSNTEKVSKGGNKDLSKLNKVKRKVMRNGKMVEMTVYEAKDDGQEENSKEQESSGESVPRTALGAKQVDNGDGNTKVNPKKLATTLGKLKSEGANVDSVSQDADMYKEFLDEQGNPIGITAFSENDTSIILEGFTGAEDVTGIGIRSVMELIKLGISKEKEVIVKGITSTEGIEFLKTLGFKDSKDYFKISKKDIKDYVGEYGNFL